MAEAKIELLRRMPAFGGLAPTVIDWIYDQSSVIAAAPGEYFFHEGDPGESLFVLQSGTVLVTRNRSGESIELGRLRQGDCFGEMALIDFRPRSATVVAETDCQAIEVPRQSLAALYQQDVQQYAIIMMNLGREVSRRLRIADDCLFDLQYRGLMPTV
ncbi:MAG: cyclic nucleotide-binding domain-containing protein [Rubripirellula sp.]